jgi:hypothetical protein
LKRPADPENTMNNSKRSGKNRLTIYNGSTDRPA